MKPYKEAFHGCRLARFSNIFLLTTSFSGKTPTAKPSYFQNSKTGCFKKTGNAHDTCSSYLRNLLGWDDLSTRRDKQLSIAMFKTLNGFFPKYLEDLFVNCDSRYNLRDRDNKLALPLPKTNYGKSSFQYCGAKIWNNLPNEVRNLNSLATFRRRIHSPLPDPHGNHGNQCQ